MRRVLALTVNVQGLGPEAASEPAAALFGRFAHGNYAWRVGMGRLLAALRQAELRATFFWSSSEAGAQPALLDACLRDGHEIACHGRAFETHAKLRREDEAALIEEARDALAARCGKVEGFRSPCGTLSAATIPLLRDFGFRYDSSNVDDDAPYPLGPDGGAGMVELPLSEGLIDATHFGRRLPLARAEAFMREELDALLPQDGFACLTLHPRGDKGVARAARIPLLTRLIERARALGAEVMTCRDIAALALRPDGGVEWNGRVRV